MAELSRFGVDNFEEAIAVFSAHTLPLLKNLYQKEAPIVVPSRPPSLFINLRGARIITEQLKGGKVDWKLYALSYVTNSDSTEVAVVYGQVSLYLGGEKSQLRTEAILSWRERQWLREATRTRLKTNPFCATNLVETTDHCLTARFHAEAQARVALAIENREYNFIDLLDVLPRNRYTSSA